MRKEFLLYLSVILLQACVRADLIVNPDCLVGEAPFIDLDQAAIQFGLPTSTVRRQLQVAIVSQIPVRVISSFEPESNFIRILFKSNCPSDPIIASSVPQVDFTFDFDRLLTFNIVGTNFGQPNETDTNLCSSRANSTTTPIDGECLCPAFATFSGPFAGTTPNGWQLQPSLSKPEQGNCPIVFINDRTKPDVFPLCKVNQNDANFVCTEPITCGAISLQSVSIFGVAFAIISLVFNHKINKILLLILVATLMIFTQKGEAQSIPCTMWAEVIVNLQPFSPNTFGVFSPNISHNLFSVEIFENSTKIETITAVPQPFDLTPACPTELTFCREIADGRPYIPEDSVIQAKPITLQDTQEDDGWTSNLEKLPNVEHLTIEERQTLSQKWLQTALGEQASVASFSSFSLQLLASGAPASLVARAHQSAMDEIRHAQLSLALASAYHPENARFSFGEYPPHQLSITPDLESLCIATAKEGCVEETLSALNAAEELDGEADDAVRRVLKVIVEEETRHSILAWDTVAWCSTKSVELKQKIVTAIVQQLELSQSRYPPSVFRVAAETIPHGLNDDVDGIPPSGIAFVAKIFEKFSRL